jgi:predicted RNA binding protein YcfA (HicA-like mRNA interferase family)
MKLPRELSGADLEKAFGRLGYQRTRKTGSHIRLTTFTGGEHHVTVPDHRVLPLGTLKSILREVASHFGCGLEELAIRLFSTR